MANQRKFFKTCVVTISALCLPATSLAQEPNAAVEEYRSLLNELETLNKYNSSLERKIATQTRLIGEKQAEVARVDEMKPQIYAMVGEWADEYAALVENDVPFDLVERGRRVARYQNAVNAENANDAIAQNFRLLIEALQIELDAGRMVTRETEEYIDESGNVVYDEDGNAELTEYLRVGRLAYIRVNEERGIFDAWNHRAKEWQKLPNSYKPDVEFGLKVAREQAAPDIMFVPVLPPESQ